MNYIKLNSSTCFERNPLIIRKSTMQIVHMQPLVSPLSAIDPLVQPLRKDYYVLMLLNRIVVMGFTTGTSHVVKVIVTNGVRDENQS